MMNRYAPFTALALKVAGIILILSFFIDFVMLLFPFQPTDKGWQIALAQALVDRGIVPMVGLGLLLAGYAFDHLDDGNRSPLDLRLPALIVSSLLGLMFLLIFPLHLNNVRQASDQTLTRITQDGDRAENQLKAQLSQLQAQLNTDQGKAQLEQLRNQRKAQLNAILQDENKYKQALESPQVPQEVKDLLKKSKANPQELDKLIAQQTDVQEAGKQQLTLIRTQREQAENQAKQGAWKSGLRIGISSLLLSIGYIIIGWTGLRGMGAVKGGGSKKAPAR